MTKKKRNISSTIPNRFAIVFRNKNQKENNIRSNVQIKYN